MATALELRLGLNLSGQVVDTLDVGAITYPASFGANYNFADGTGGDQAKKIWTDTRTLTASATENLDLAGVLVDAFGVTLTFTKVKALIVTAAAANTNDVLVGGHASGVLFFANANDIVKVRPGGMFALVSPDSTGYAVTASTGDLLTVANSAGSTSVTYTIIIIGVV